MQTNPPGPAGAARPLRRVRIADRQEADGTKRVWHSSGDGVDLATEVAPDGHAVFQELTFHRRLVEWRRDGGLRTGLDDEREPAKPGRAALPIRRYDARASEEVLREALAVTASADEDRYVAHLREVLVAALDGLARAGTEGEADAAKVPAREVTLQPGARPRPTWKDRIRALFGH